MRPVSIGVQAAAMIDCPIRVPLIVHAKLRKIDVKDPVDLAAVRRGRLIHAAFEEAAVRLDEAGNIGDEAIAAAEIAGTIATALPELDIRAVAAQASSLAATISAAVAGRPGIDVAHERRVSVLLVPGVMVSGRVDTVVEGEDGWLLVERKTGQRHPWHARQVQLYADMVLAANLCRRVARLELWYSGGESGTVEVPHAPGERLEALRAGAARGVALDPGAAMLLVQGGCEGCPRDDCGVKRLARLASFRG
ncbi:MAG: PD-(D/E)XK nuclease family protein [Candidatus Lokiarchaeota archaeon]|nr:PD-(D/E)XK nuclease family protein [Candidatus Lokiarchaeota archaeon]